MSQSVDRLKELLFESEAKSLSDLERRLVSLAAEEEIKRTEISKRVDTVFDRAGTQERFVDSVADVLDGALRKAELDRHSALSDAVAPIVVKTIKTEIRNSRDELVEALYPMTGRMVQAYVASAMKDLANDINRRLEANPVMLRLRSLMSGKSVAELAMAESQRLQVEELYLVRRGTGELLARWPEASEEPGLDHVLSGILAAINDYSTAALSGEASTLRQIDIGERQLYLRASPLYLLAAKCAGTAPAEVETILDEAFLGTLERIQSMPAGTENRSLLADMSAGLGTSVQEKQDQLANERAGVSPLKMLAWIIGLPLASWLAWNLYADYKTDQAHAIASEVMSSTPSINGYPTRLDVSRWGRVITIAGLVPTEGARSELTGRLSAALPKSDIRDRLSVLPSGLEAIEPEIARVRREIAGLEPELDKVRKDVREFGPQISKFRDEVSGVRDTVSGFDPKVATVRDRLAKIEPEISKVQVNISALEASMKLSAAQRALARAAQRLDETAVDVKNIEASLDGSASREKAARAAAVIAQARKDIDREAAAISTSPGAAADSGLPGKLAMITVKVESAASVLSALIAPGNAAAARTSRQSAPAGLAETAEDLSAGTERLAATAIAIGQAVALRKSLPEAVQPVLPQPSLRDRLEAWTRANAIFFANGTEFRNAERTAQALDALAALMKEGDHLIRIVGYTDDKGSTSRNSPLSRERADRVAAELAARGIPAGRLVAIGRIDSRDLSPTAGDMSPNRRVEFEVGFDGEAQQ